MAIQPIEDRIVVEPRDTSDKTAGGIILPDKAREKPQQGKVIAVGPGKRLENGTIAKPLVRKGDTVLYGKYSGTEFEHKGKDYLILKEDDVLAKIE